MSKVEIGIFTLILLNCLYLGFLYGKHRARQDLIRKIFSDDHEFKNVDEDMIIEEVIEVTATSSTKRDGKLN